MPVFLVGLEEYNSSYWAYLAMIKQGIRFVTVYWPAAEEARYSRLEFLDQWAGAQRAQAALDEQNKEAS